MLKKLNPILFILLIFLIVFISGCTETYTDEKSRFIGKWRLELFPTYTWTFYENGTVMTCENGTNFYNLTYTAQDGNLSFYIPGYPNDPLSYYYRFYDNDSRVNLSMIASPEDTFVIVRI